MTRLYDFSARRIDGREWPLSQLKGQVVLVVNTASACGFTPQFAGLQALHEQYGERGLTVIGFPCNQFGGQDPNAEPQILSFCQKNYGVSFAMMSKVEVNGSAAHPLFQWLTRSAPGVLGTESIKWNFTKFLVGKDGQVIGRYGSVDKPESLRSDIEAALEA
jgi:glutathione peroxidase